MIDTSIYVNFRNDLMLKIIIIIIHYTCTRTCDYWQCQTRALQVNDLQSLVSIENAL